MKITRVMNRFIFLVLLVNVCALAEVFVPPKSMELFGKQYTLAFQNENADVALYEYTTDNEPVENWNRLITLQYYKRKLEPLEFITAMKAGLDSRKPIPHYSLYQKEEHGYALLIFEPSREHLHFEADVQKSFHPVECDGTLILQYGVRTPTLQQLSSEDKSRMLKDVYGQLKLDAEQIAQNKWVPTCE
ncbi:MAG: hypothetical protein Q7U69_05065 [Sulfuricurvum sp.]|uniref:hypothetical protein n=1 Tax=Sulfuricurvum sp. TaxID=2025608 RepID=UPI002724C624|nr:hypothetical protein [Sulfuricurvum sp.]MDO9055897.1 hypothetical protein [Sulfuricurvum sp.]